MPIKRCAECGVSLGTLQQESLSGMLEYCPNCQTKREVKHMLALLPEEGDDPERDRLNDWENNFLDSVREQFEKKRLLSERQFLVLCRLYDRLK